jgi:glyoxylase-like metal-dependent hydrolase (beta-lactamase superfamily II)
MLELKKLVVGGFEANCYILKDRESGETILVDPGAQAERILDWIGQSQATKIIITHGHSDHVGALTEVRQVLGCPVGGHALDADKFGLDFDFTLGSNSWIDLGSARLEVYEIPGHTPGSVALALHEEDFKRALVGDAIFPGGPGHTQSHQDLRQLLEALEQTVFTWPDQVTLYPGHGDPTTVGAERTAFEKLQAKELPEDLYGDVTWY